MCGGCRTGIHDEPSARESASSFRSTYYVMFVLILCVCVCAAGVKGKITKPSPSYIIISYIYIELLLYIMWNICAY